MKVIAIISFCFLIQITAKSQYILNGDFEINNGFFGTDYLELSNAQFNNLLPNCNSFGTSSTDRIDLISTNTWGVTAQSGNWYIGISKYQERFSMELSSPLISGAAYKLTFYQAAREQNGKTYLKIGVSNTNNTIGTVVYEGVVPNTFDQWELNYFTFIAPNNGQYITVECGQDECCWIKVDNFCLSVDTFCVELPEILMPNVFTPNSDGINDNFSPSVFKGMKSGKLIILNRWGQTIFETTDVTQGWNGTYKGNQCSAGIYYYIIEYIDIFDNFNTQNGFLTLIK